MPTYAGVEFSIVLNGGAMPLDFEQPEAVAVTHIPGSDEDDVQWGGFGNGRLAISAGLDDYADYLTLKAARGLTKRTLVHDGRNYTSVMLLHVGKPSKHPERDTVFADLEFMQAGS